jgi:hypothetical protein
MYGVIKPEIEWKGSPWQVTNYWVADLEVGQVCLTPGRYSVKYGEPDGNGGLTGVIWGSTAFWVALRTSYSFLTVVIKFSYGEALPDRR